MATPLEIANRAERAAQFRDVRKTARQLVADLESSEDYVLGKREAAENFPTLREFELKKNKVVKVSDVIAAANLIAANFIVRTWPNFLKTKLEEYAVSKIGSAAAKAAATKIAAKGGVRAVSGWLAALFGSLFTAGTQEIEMRKLEREIRRMSTALRRELNETALSQAKKPVRMGKVVTRNG